MYNNYKYIISEIDKKETFKMGHDLMLKNCPRPLGEECISGGSCDHETEKEGYISFNHSSFRKYWHVSMSHGHLSSVVSRQLARAIAQMAADGFTPGIPPGGDGWTRTPGVFMLHLTQIKDMVDRNPDTTFLSDQYWHVNPLQPEYKEYDDDNDDDDEQANGPLYEEPDDEVNCPFYEEPDDEVNGPFYEEPDDEVNGPFYEEPDDEVKQEVLVTYFRHPIKGNMKVHNFATASEVYTLMILNGDRRAQMWLDIARRMPDAPK